MDEVLLRKPARRIKDLRKKHGFSQDDLSFYSGIARSTLGNIETAKNDIVFSKIKKLADAFKLSLSEFINF